MIAIHRGTVGLFGFGHAITGQFPDLSSLKCRGPGPVEPVAVLPGVASPSPFSDLYISSVASGVELTGSDFCTAFEVSFVWVAEFCTGSRA